MEVEIRGFEQLGSLFDDVVSLDVFSPDIEQTDAWPLDAIDSRNVGTTGEAGLKITLRDYAADGSRETL